MKKNAKLPYLFIGIFFLLCLIPSLGMLFFGPSPLLANESAPRTPALRDRFLRDFDRFLRCSFHGSLGFCDFVLFQFVHNSTNLLI